MGGEWRPHFWVWIFLAMPSRWLGSRNKARNECVEDTHLFAAAGASHTVGVPAPERAVLALLHIRHPQQHQHHLVFNPGADTSAVQSQLFAVQDAMGQPAACSALPRLVNTLYIARTIWEATVPDLCHAQEFQGDSTAWKSCSVEYVCMAAGAYYAVIWDSVRT